MHLAQERSNIPITWRSRVAHFPFMTVTLGLLAHFIWLALIFSAVSYWITWR